MSEDNAVPDRPDDGQPTQSDPLRSPISSFGLGESAPEVIGSNTPISLNNPDTIYLIYHGAVDVFAVHTANDVASGARRHLFRAVAGTLLLGFDLRDFGDSLQIVAVGIHDTEVARLPRLRFEGLLRDLDSDSEAILLLDKWIASFSLGVAESTALRQFIPLVQGEPIQLAPGQITRPLRTVMWTRCLDGSAQFMSMPELPLITRDDFLPVTPDTWLSSAGGATIYAVDTRTFVTESFSWIYISNFHRAMLNTIIWRMEQSEQIELERLKKRTQYDRRQLNQAVHHLADILHPDARTTVSGDTPDEALLAACQLVGRNLGVRVEAPPDPVDGRSRNLSLEAIVQYSGIRVREVMLRGKWWKQDNGPLLAYMETDKRPVALIPRTTSSYDLHDPATNSVRYVNRDVAGELASFAYSFYRTLPNRALSARDLWRFGLRRSKRDIWMVLLMGVFGGLIGTLIPLITGRIFDFIIPSAARDQLIQFGLLLFSTAIAAAVFQIVRSIAVLRIEVRLDGELQSALWDRLLNLPTPFFRRYSAGDLSERSLGITTIRRVVSGTIVLTVLSSIFSVFNFFLLFYFDPGLALVATLLIIIAVTVTVIAGYRQMRYQRLLADVQGYIAGMVLQFITGISKLRVAGVEGRAFVQWANRFTEQKTLSYKAGHIENVLAVFNATYPVLTSLVIFAAVSSATNLTTGEFLAFNAAFTQFLLAGLELTTAFILVLRVVPNYERMRPILQAVPEVDETKTDPGELSGEIEASHVNFRYKQDGPLILKDVSFQVKPGDFVALVGPSGSGKSTLLRLLLGFERSESGSIFYDGQDLSGIDIRSARQQLGVVLQNSQLMSGDIFTNIVGVAPLTLDDAWDAARMAGLDDDIRQMPMGMHTIISEGGSTLSGGQRQRLLIARAIAKKPKILFFDEATSALDNRTQAIVSQSLESLDATRVVIAHRLSTIIHADMILVMHHGEIVQSGRYEELIRQKGVFAELARRQLV